MAALRTGRRSRALALAGLLGLSAAGCGGGATSTAPRAAFAPSTAPVSGYVKGDQDGDYDAQASDDDDAAIRGYGHPASAGDRTAALRLLKRYYAAAAAGDAATACSLTFAPLAKNARLAGYAAEDYAPLPGSPPLRGRSCVTVISVLARERHEVLAGDVALLVLTEMRVRGDRALAVLGFRTTGERVIALRRVRGAWRVDGLFDAGVL